jgi:hypothetical protein
MGKEGEFHGRSSLQKAKELMASEKFAERILPNGRQSIADEGKMEMKAPIADGRWLLFWLASRFYS